MYPNFHPSFLSLVFLNLKEIMYAIYPNSFVSSGRYTIPNFKNPCKPYTENPEC